MTDTRASRTPVIIGFLIAGAAILGASFLVGTLSDSPRDAVPPLGIAAPASGDSVRNPITLEVRTPADLAFDPGMGWTAGELHLHAMVDGVEIMPAAADIVAHADGWSWRLPPLDTGTYRVHLSWAGRHHGNLPGVADTIVVHVRD